MEAMASGLPVITTDIPENQILIEDKKSGLLIPVKNSSAIIQAIKELFGSADLTREIKENALIKIQEHFDVKIVLSKLAHFLITL